MPTVRLEARLFAPCLALVVLGGLWACTGLNNGTDGAVDRDGGAFDGAKGGTGGSPRTGGSGGASGGSGVTGGSGGTGGANVTGGARTGGNTTTGGSGTGGSATGGVVATGGTATGGVGTGGVPGCASPMKSCNGSCVAASTCCGGCSGGTPVCNNGTCVARVLGEACGGNGECALGFCVDGVCCNEACNGQCEACATAASKGTCVAVTTARTGCTGTGTCGGRCDGTNRKACAYPTNATSCGAAASCASNAATSAALCNGGGACTASITMSCMFGCRTDGTIGCASSCPTGQALCGGTSCVDVLSSDNRCGTGCTACKGATPRCSNGACVECNSGTDCPSAGASCTASHTCQCRQPSTGTNGNLFKNPGMAKSSGTASWVITGGGTWISDDLDSCVGSGSLRLPSSAVATQCVGISASTAYYVSFMYKQDDSSAIFCSLNTYTGGNCSGSFVDSGFVFGETSASTSWRRATIPALTSSAGTGSAELKCTGTSPVTILDQFYVGRSSSAVF